MFKRATIKKNKANSFFQSRFYLYLLIIGIVVFDYVIIRLIIQHEWFEAFLYGLLSLTIFVIPLVHRLKKSK